MGIKHLIIGAGNLGLDLYEEVKRNEDVCILDGFLPGDIPTLQEKLKPKHVWLCAGAGSVEAADQDFPRQIATHISLPLMLAQRLPKDTTLHVFSTDYLCEFKKPHQAKSLYAQGKLAMEQMLAFIQRPLRIYRVGSLYGRHLPLKTFPGKILAAEQRRDPQAYSLPRNQVVPTPTAWLAQLLLKHCDTPWPLRHAQALHIRPKGEVGLWEWAKLVNPGPFYEGVRYDLQRPLSIAPRKYFPFEDEPHWRELWDIHGMSTVLAARAALEKE